MANAIQLQKYQGLGISKNRKLLLNKERPRDVITSTAAYKLEKIQQLHQTIDQTRQTEKSTKIHSKDEANTSWEFKGTFLPAIMDRSTVPFSPAASQPRPLSRPVRLQT